MNKKTEQSEQKLRSAFSLIEVMVVMAMVSILAVFSMVSFSSIAPKGLETQSRKLANDLCWVRDMAQARHKNFIIEFVPTMRQYLIYKDSVANDNLLERKSLEVSSIAIIPASSLQLQFNYPKGNTAQNVQVVLRQGALTRNIIIFSETGYVYRQ